MKFKKLIVFALGAALLGFSWSCDKDDDEPEPTPTPQEDAASQAVTSDQEAVIETPGGAALYIPEGAVPRQEDGSASTMVFSLETDDDYEVNLPEGETMDSRLYRLGPEGFTFERAVTVEIPLLDDRDPGDMVVNLYRVNPTTGDVEQYAGDYNYERRTVSAQTHHFSPWFLSCRAHNDTAWGCAWVENRSDKWIGLCVETYDFTYGDRLPDDGFSSYWAPWFHNLGVTNEGEWWLPQGTYTICAQYSHDAGAYYTHRTLPQELVVDNAARASWISQLQNYDCTLFEVYGDGVGPDYIDGPCNCIPTPTRPVGTGDIQVTLTWWNTLAIDLDLWMMEPDSTWCGFSNSLTVNGSQLDRDNLCGNYENGRPENIYSTTTPLAGEYVVDVDWWSDCGNGMTSQAYTVRTVVAGVTRSFTGTITPDPRRIEVTRFTISGGAVTFSDGQGFVERAGMENLTKN